MAEFVDFLLRLQNVKELLALVKNTLQNGSQINKKVSKKEQLI
jgi:hypothetical protein